MERDGSSSPRHSDKSHSHAAAAAASRANTTSAQAAAATAAAFNYSAFLNASVSGNDSVMLGSTENLLRNIQGLLKVAAENARQQDRQANYEKGKKMLVVDTRLSFSCHFSRKMIRFRAFKSKQSSPIGRILFFFCFPFLICAHLE